MNDGQPADGLDGTVCPFCSVGCRLEPDGDRVRGRAGPANPNGRLCEKGLRAFDAVDDADRLTAPLVREGDDLVQTTWERALDRVVGAFDTIHAARGPDALAFLGAPRSSNEENYLLQKLARTLGTNNVDNRARLCHAETAGVLADRLGWPATTNTLGDLRRADVILVVGADPATRQPVAFDSAVRPAVGDGATLVHVDPHQNATTRLADRHVAPLPGTDALVVSTLCALVVVEGCVDRRFVRDRTTGFEQYRDWLDSLDPSDTAGGAGIDADDLRDVAATIAAADRVAVMTGTGADEVATADALVNLLALTGSLGRPGTGFHLLRGLSNEQGATDAGCVPHRLPGHRQVTDRAAREDVADEWGVEPPSTPGRTEHDLLAAFGEEVHGALVVGENPAVSKHDPDWVGRRLEALDALVVIELFPTETTEYADVVLPAAAGVEKTGTVTNLDRQIQPLCPLASPPGEARTDFAILRDIGQRLVAEALDGDLVDGFAFDDPGAALDELTRVSGVHAGTSAADLETRSRRWPIERAGGDSSDGILYRERFATPDGRVGFVRGEFPGERDGHKGRDDGDENDSGAGRFHLVVADRYGAFTGTGGDAAERRVTVHPADADDLAVADGDGLLLSNEAGSIEVTARVRESIRPGAIHLLARVADPLVRGGRPRVDVEPAGNGDSRGR